MALTDLKIKAAAPRDKLYKLSDSEGLQLHVSPSGGKLWRYAYRVCGKQKLLALGAYPLISLKAARDKRDDAKRLLLVGVDPNEQKKTQKRRQQAAVETSFESIANEWFDHWKGTKNERYANYVITRLKADVFPEIGYRQVADITPNDLVVMTKKIESRGSLEVAKRNYRVCGQIFRYAIAHGQANRNPTSEVSSVDFLKPREVKNYARIEYKDLPEFLTKVEAYVGSNLTRLAMKLMALTFIRTSELIKARWDEIDFENSLWVVPEHRMKKTKTRDKHFVPLSRQAIEVLKTLQVLTGHSKFLFPGERDHERPMSNNTILGALKRMGYKGRMTGHGYRGLASTILNEAGFNFYHVEAQLSHLLKNQVAGAYNHAKYMDQRKLMMNWWGDYLDTARGGAPYPFPKLPEGYAGA